MKLSEISAFLGGKLNGDPEIEISGLAKIESAKKGDLTFLSNPKYAKYLSTTKASAVLVSHKEQGVPLAHIQLDDPYLGFVRLTSRFNKQVHPDFNGIHSMAQVDKSAKVGENTQIGPFVYVGKNARVGKNCFIYPGCVLMDDVHIGDDSVLYPNVSIREKCEIGKRVILHNGVVIGSDGFGFAPSGEEYEKIPQVGRVVVEDDVEIGANSCIDRATLGETIIHQGCKIDNMVQLAHNVEVAPNTVIAAQTGVAGSTKIGKHVTIAGQVGIVGHIKIGDGAILAAKSGISKDVPGGEVWFGYPAGPIMKQKKIEVNMRHLPEIAKKIHQLEKTIIALNEKLNQSGNNE